MLYLKINNVVIEIESFTMFHYQEDMEPKFSCTFSESQSTDALDSILNESTIKGLAVYSDAECTHLFWSSNHDFVLQNAVENWAITDEDPTKMNRYLDLKVC